MRNLITFGVAVLIALFVALAINQPTKKLTAQTAPTEPAPASTTPVVTATTAVVVGRYQAVMVNGRDVIVLDTATGQCSIYQPYGPGNKWVSLGSPAVKAK